MATTETAGPAGRVLDAAVAVAANAPAKRGQFVSSALVYWPLVEELRAALDALGVEWRPGSKGRHPAGRAASDA